MWEVFNFEIHFLVCVEFLLVETKKKGKEIVGKKKRS